MAKSQIIKNIAKNEITLEEGLQRTLIIVYDLNNEPLKEWLQNEINGYTKDTKLPSYRKDLGCITYYSGINGSFKITKQPLPSGYVDDKFRELLKKGDYKDNISTVERIVKSQERLVFSLTDLAGHIFDRTGVQCYSIIKEFSAHYLEQIVSNVKNRLIMILLDLEKEFGELDSLDIDTKVLTQEEYNGLNKKLNNIIYSDGKGEEVGNERIF